VNNSETLKRILSQHGPINEDYSEIINIVNQLNTDDEIENFRTLMDPVLIPETIIGHSFQKPLGYSGDYQIIEKIYDNHRNPRKEYVKWDEFFHCLPAAIAVNNRKQMAVKLLHELNEKAAGKSLKVLILGSGPATEVKEYFDQCRLNTLSFDLVDFDQRAIDYAIRKNLNYLDFLTFHNKNVLRFIPDYCYDFIWSAGLFDYFQDRLFVRLLRRMFLSVQPGGQMIIGNFSTSNPSRKVMEILGDWHLYHRSENQLSQFALEAGVPLADISILREPLGINLFLKVEQKNQSSQSERQ
jgi:extracellular factor (EF) 3-hydroxypalmitic acid methyl ester biosynthesis protein